MFLLLGEKDGDVGDSGMRMRLVGLFVNSLSVFCVQLYFG